MASTPAAEIVLSPSLAWGRSSAPGCSPSSVMTRTATPRAKARKNYAGTTPITRASGKKKATLARFVHNDRLIDALMAQAFSALKSSPGARAYYDKQRNRGVEYNAALRQLSNRLVGILHGCLKTGTSYDEETAWPQRAEPLAAWHLNSWDVFRALMCWPEVLAGG